MTDASVDVVVVGGGHNGLICAAYLARAGLDVIVVEQNDGAGGALMSSEWEGYRLEHGAVEHTAVLTSGVIDELGLEDLGLSYRTRDVAAIHLFGDGASVTIGRTVEATAESIASISARDARAWTDLSERSAPLLRAFAIASGGWVPPMSVATRVARAIGGRDAAPLVDLAQMSVIDLATKWFESPHVRALAIFRASFLGLPPWAPGTANAFLLTTGGHGRRLGRPLGGSRAFVAALAAAVTDGGGVVRCGFRVESVSRRGAGWTVRSTAGEEITARRAVVSAIPPQDFVLRLLSPADVVPTSTRRATRHARGRRVERQPVDDRRRPRHVVVRADVRRSRRRPGNAVAAARTVGRGRHLQRDRARPRAVVARHARRLPDGSRPRPRAAGGRDDVGQRGRALRRPRADVGRRSR